MYNPEYMSYMNEQIKKVKEKLISEFVKDLKNFSPLNKPPNTINDLIKKWEEKS